MESASARMRLNGASVNAITVSVRGVDVVVDEEKWESHCTFTSKTRGVVWDGRLCDARWLIHRYKHTSYVYAIPAFKPNVNMLLHRMVLGALPSEIVDHINHDGLDNRAVNLRIATIQQNNHNRRKVTGTTSRFVGVSFCKTRNRWRSYIREDGRLRQIGMFKSEVDAAIARDNFVKESRPEFGYLNFPDVALVLESEATR